jgi:hypothetical protein
MYRLFVLINSGFWGLAALIGVRLAFATPPKWPTGFAPYCISAFGLFGAIGLWRVATGHSPIAAARRRTDVLLLVVGVVAALLLILPIIRIGLSAVLVPWLFLLCVPMVIAIVEIRRHMPALSDIHGPRTPLVRTAILILLSPVALALGRDSMKEATTKWYGREFPRNAYASAERIADGMSYRITVEGYPADANFNDLDKEALLGRAFENHFAFGGMSGRWIEPHMRLYVGEEKYLWSFRKGEFYR